MKGGIGAALLLSVLGMGSVAAQAGTVDKEVAPWVWSSKSFFEDRGRIFHVKNSTFVVSLVFQKRPASQASFEDDEVSSVSTPPVTQAAAAVYAVTDGVAYRAVPWTSAANELVYGKGSRDLEGVVLGVSPGDGAVFVGDYLNTKISELMELWRTAAGRYCAKYEHGNFCFMPQALADNGVTYGFVVVTDLAAVSVFNMPQDYVELAKSDKLGGEVISYLPKSYSLPLKLTFTWLPDMSGVVIRKMSKKDETEAKKGKKVFLKTKKPVKWI